MRIRDNTQGEVNNLKQSRAKRNQHTYPDLCQKNFRSAALDIISEVVYKWLFRVFNMLSLLLQVNELDCRSFLHR